MEVRVYIYALVVVFKGSVSASLSNDSHEFGWLTLPMTAKFETNPRSAWTSEQVRQPAAKEWPAEPSLAEPSTERGAGMEVCITIANSF